MNLPCGPCLSSPQPWRHPGDSLRLSSWQTFSACVHDLHTADCPISDTTRAGGPVETPRVHLVPRATFHPWGASRPHPMLSTPKGSARTWWRAAPSAKRFVVEPGSNSGRPHQLAAIGVIEPTAISAHPSISRRNRLQCGSLRHHPGVDIPPQGDQQFPRKGDNADAAHSRATVPKSLLIPARERTQRLKA